MPNNRLRHKILAVLMAGICMLAVGTARSFTPEPVEPAVHVEINIPEFKLRVYRDGQVIRTFPVGVGRPGYPTPIGHFRVITAVEHPIWENPYMGPGARRIGAGKDNPLGTRWIGFHRTAQGEYGMHGTDSPETVGKLSSHGCIRMKIPDAEALYGMISVGTPVRVIYETHRLGHEGGKLLLHVFPDPYRRGQPDLKSLQAHARQQYPHAVIFDEAVWRSAVSKSSPRTLVVGFSGSSIPYQSLAP